MPARTTRKPARASIRKKASSAKTAPRIGRNAAPKYVVDFPVDYVVQKPFHVDVKPGFAATVVVLPAGRDKKGRMDFRIVLVVREEAGRVTFTPRALGMMLIQVPAGQDSTPAAVQPSVKRAWVDGNRGEAPGIVR